MGHISKEPRWHIHNGQRYLFFQLVTTEWLKKESGRILHEEHHTVNIPENSVNMLNLVKGDIVYLQGRLQTKMFLDEKQIRHYRTEILASSIEIVDMAFAAAHAQ